MDHVSDSMATPRCPGDGLPLVSTVAGWRCPNCGMAALRNRRSSVGAVKVNHPASR